MKPHSHLTTDHRALPPGFMLGSLRIEGLLGRGGFAFTYLGSTTSRSGSLSYYAIKELFPPGALRRSTLHVVPSGPSESGDFQFALSRFIREAEILTRCDHPNVVKIVDAFRYNGTAYIIMPYVDGESFAQHCSGAKDHTHMHNAEIVYYLMEILQALDYLHKRGITHRDLKPANLYLTAKKRPMLLDFGMAKVEHHFHRIGQRKPSVLVESQGYSPWEQFIQGGEIGAWTDIYAMGALLHFLINPYGNRTKHGAPPRAADRLYAVTGRKSDPYIRLSQYPKLQSIYSPWLLAAVDSALEIDFKRRPQSIHEWCSSMDLPKYA